jgi:hypothetical protein
LVFAWVLFIFSLVAFILYLVLSLRLFNVTNNQIDSFSKKIICIYSIAFLVSTILWLIVAIDLDLSYIESYNVTNAQFAQVIFEDIVNLSFQITLYIFVFKMISVYNLAISETLEQLKKKERNLKVLRITVLTIVILLEIASIVIKTLYFAIEKISTEQRAILKIGTIVT